MYERERERERERGQCGSGLEELCCNRLVKRVCESLFCVFSRCIRFDDKRIVSGAYDG